MAEYLSEKPEFEELYTVAEVAEMLRYHPQSIRKMIEGGVINAIKISGQYRITRTEINRLLKG